MNCHLHRAPDDFINAVIIGWLLLTGKDSC